MTLGYYGIARGCVRRRSRISGWQSDSTLYANDGTNFLGPDKDCDGDGYTNLEEWQYTIGEGAWAVSQQARATGASPALHAGPGHRAG